MIELDDLKEARTLVATIRVLILGTTATVKLMKKKEG